MSPFNLTTRAFARIVQLLKKRLGHFATATAVEANAGRDAATSGEHLAAALSSQPSLSAAATDADQLQSAAVATQPADQSAESTVEQQDDSAAAVAALSTSATTREESSPVPEVSVAAAAAPAQPAAAAPPSSTSAPSPSPSWPSSPIPLLLLGGGGYCPTDSARAFVHLTAAACARPLPAALPDSDPLYPHYLPNLSLHSQPKPAAMRPNANDRAYLRRLISHVRDNCSRRKQMQESGDEE
jgi:paired amphipathic helix protein Sin3a